MKKILLALVAFLCLVPAGAQTKPTIDILGIKVDGTLKQMKSQLRKKGFHSTDYTEMYGKFEGADTHILIHPRKTIVDYVVLDTQDFNEQKGIALYNRILKKLHADKRLALVEGQEVYEVDVTKVGDDGIASQASFIFLPQGKVEKPGEIYIRLHYNEGCYSVGITCINNYNMENYE